MAAGFDPYYRWLAIPPEQQPPTHYRLLGLDPLEDDPEVIGFAADRNMMHVRTYQGGKFAAEAERLLNEIAAAKVCLLDRAKKAAYDRKLISARRTASEVPLPSPDAPRPVLLVGELLEAAPQEMTAAQVPALLPAKRPTTAIAVAISAPWLNDLVADKRFVTLAALAGGGAILAAVLFFSVVALVLAEVLTKDLDKPPIVTEVTDQPPDEVAQQNNSAPVVPPVLPPKLPALAASTTTALQPDARGAIDLLPLVDVVRDTVSGVWQIDQGELVAQPSGFSRLEIPVIPPAEYDLEVVATRTGGNEDLVVGMVYQERSCGAVLDGWRGSASGLAVDNSSSGAILFRSQKLITNGQRVTVRCMVRDDHLAATVNGKEFLRFAGVPSWRTTLPSWAARDHRFLVLGTMNSTYRIHTAKLMPIRGAAQLVQHSFQPPAAAFADDGSIYLDDLPEIGARLGHGVLGKHGQTGYGNGVADPKEVRVSGTKYSHALSTHPGPVHPALVAYAIDGKFRSLTMSVGIVDPMTPQVFGGELIFSVVGDGRTLWQSQAITKHGQTQSATIDVGGVRRLELITQCRGPFFRAWAVWLEPKLSP